MPLTYADISKARALLGYDPHTQIAEGIPRFVEWYRSGEVSSEQLGSKQSSPA